MSIISVDKRTKKNLELFKNNMDTDIAEQEKLYGDKAATVRDIYSGTINDNSADYIDLERQNSVQRLINEREVEENMASLGLTDSGLNRTQMTAVQLSAANNAAKIQREKQAMINSLMREMTAELSNIEGQRSAAVQGIKDSYTTMAKDMAIEEYNTDVEAETERQKAYYSALETQYENQAKVDEQNSYIIKTSGGLLNRGYTGTLKDNNIDTIFNYDEYGNVKDVTYVDNKSGKKTTLNYGVNPYTGTINKDTANGVFSNGYQPNNIGGYKLKAYDEIEIDELGTTQKVWNLVKGHNTEFYVWDGSQNKYLQVIKSNGEWKVK